MPSPLQVVEVERMRFRVHSERKPSVTYFVDILEHRGIGECTCPDWITRRWPLIRDGAKITDDSILCKHVIAAREHFLAHLLAAMAAKENQ